ncbi:MAG TPA: TonB-dependent receptor [Gemmatimonadales bacterium]
MKRAVPLLCLFILVVAVPSSLTAQAQATTGIIRGVVVDPAGNAVGGATVMLRETQTNFQRSLTTNPNGVFVATLLPLGTYDVAARAVGYNESRQTGIPLRVGATVDLRLLLGAITLPAVTVEATPPLVDPTRIEAATRLAAEVATGLPNNGRNFLNLTLLTPNVALVQGPDGDELTIAGQRGIHNNVSVDGADFNNPFFGEHRGGQRPPFTFNLDAVQEIVVVAGGANAEFGRSSGGFVNVITKSGTNELRGSAHYFGKYDALSSPFDDYTRSDGLVIRGFEPDFSQHQMGFTLGGPLKRDKAFFFLAYDQQVYDETKQKDASRIGDAALRQWMDTAFGGALGDDYGPIARTNDARALLAKVDFRLSPRHNLTLKYNHTWSEQRNGTFDVDAWGRSANGLEQVYSNAGNLALASFLSPSVTNEFRVQFSREDRPRPYTGARSTLLGPNPADPPATRPFPDTGMDFVNGYRFGMPFFLPIEYYDTRIQVLDNISIAKGDHLFKFGAEWNRVESVQTFIGFANGRFIFSSVNGFLNYVEFGNQYVECSGGGSSTTGACPGTETITGPVLLYLQQAGVDRSVREAGTQAIPQHDLAFYVQDSWKPDRRWTVNYGLRWEAQVEPRTITPRNQTFYAVYYDSTVVNATGTYSFPSDGTIPSDWSMFQPRLGVAFDPAADGRQVFRASAGLYYARIPGLNLASTRSTDGARGVTLFGSSPTLGFLPPPNYGTLLPSQIPAASVAFPSVFVFDKDFRNPRTINLTVGYERQLAKNIAGSFTLTHARTDHLTRFFNRNDALFGSPWGSGPRALGTLTVVESSAKSRYTGMTVGLYRSLDPNLQFQINYTLSWDKSDDDNERDPFTFRYARVDNLVPEYHWSDRDQRHRLNAWLLSRLPGGVYVNARVSVYSAQPVSESCGPSPFSPFAPPRGQRATSALDRNCSDGSVLTRNTLRKDNAAFAWDVRLSKQFALGQQNAFEVILVIFNVPNRENFRDPAYGGLLFNFDGTIRSGLGDPRQLQAGLRWAF